VVFLRSGGREEPGKSFPIKNSRSTLQSLISIMKVYQNLPQRMEYAFLRMVFSLVNEVQQDKLPSDFHKHRKSLWAPKSRSKGNFKVS